MPVNTATRTFKKESHYKVKYITKCTLLYVRHKSIDLRIICSL